MKRCLLLFILLIPVVLYSQEIKSNVVDPFTNERTIETTIVTLKQGLSTGLGVSLSAVDRNYYLHLVGYGQENTIVDKDDKFWLVMEDGDVVQFNLRVNIEDGEESKRNIYIHHYYMRYADLEKLKDKKLAIVRIASSTGLTDIKISKKSSKHFSKLTEVFFTEINKS